VALISPILDDRTYEQLREELVKRIPVYAPEWTDHNESDPGIALLELFAYLGESLLYRFNQIPDTTKIAFLRLLGVAPRPATPASALITVSTDLAAGVLVPREAEAKAGAVSFATEADLQAWPLDCVAAGKTPAPEPVTRADRDRREDAAHRRSLRADDPKAYYETSLVPADPAQQDAQPLDVATTIDQSLWIVLLRRPTITDIVQLAGRSVFIGLAFDVQVQRPFDLQSLDAAQAAAYGSPDLLADPPPMLWRLWNGPPKPAGAEAFTSVEIGSDSTRGLTSTGVVEVILPDPLPTFDPLDPLLGGTDSPPPLPDEDMAANVIAWLQVARPKTAHIDDVIRRVSWVGINVVGVQQSLKTTPELLGIGDGDSDQRYPLAHRPVLPETVQLQVEEADGWQPWSEVEPHVRGGPNDRYFTVDYTAGSVSFTGERVPQPGQQIRVLAYRYGGGTAGNVAAGAISALVGVSGTKDVSNRWPQQTELTPPASSTRLTTSPQRYTAATAR
jgi:predicted phage baseplate assembly protein